MRLSVALCTYNGEKFIEEQLESILCQSVSVDEIVVCDDGSTDKTLQIIERLRTEHNANILIYHNEKNLGVCANFQQAVNRCSGEIIFLADQDDIWYPNKVECITQWFRKHPDKRVVFTDGTLFRNAHTASERDTLFERIGFGPKYQAYFDAGCELPVFYCNHATGATMAMRGKMDFAAYCTPQILHDEVISLLAIQSHSLGYLPQTLIQYRIHDSQEMSIPPDMQSAERRFNELHILDPDINISRAHRWRFPLTDDTLAYLRFSKQRARFSWSIFCYLYILRHLATYRQQYGTMYRRFISYDRSIFRTRIKKIAHRALHPAAQKKECPAQENHAGQNLQL